MVVAMARHSLSEKEVAIFLNRLPGDERLLRKIKDAGEEIAGFYGFEKVGIPTMDEARLYTPLFKAGFFGQRNPLFAKMSTGHEVVVGFPAVFSAIRAYHSPEFRGGPYPVKIRFDGRACWTPGGGVIAERDEWGLLMVGEEGPVAEAEIVYVLWKAIEKGAGLDDCEVMVNAVGCKECRSHFRSVFMTYARGRIAKLCRSCVRDLKTNPMKILRCAEEKCRMTLHNTPQVLDYICDPCKKHLRGFLEFLDELSVPYFLDQTLFIDGAWMNEFVFEIVSRADSVSGVKRAEGSAQIQEKECTPVTGSRVVLAEGGRVSQAGNVLTGVPMEAASGTLWLDAIVAHAVAHGVVAREKKPPHVFVAQLGELAKRKSFAILEILRDAGFTAQESLGRDSIKSQLNVAERVGASVALIVGQKEALDGTVIVRELSSGVQETVPQEKLVEFLKKKVKK